LIVLNQTGEVLYAWQHFDDDEASEVDIQANFAAIDDVRLALDGVQDEWGDKRAILMETPAGYLLYAVGPVYLNDEAVGAALVGTDVNKMVAGLSENAIARVTLYDNGGNVLATTLGSAQDESADVLATLQESPKQVQNVLDLVDEKVHLRPIQLLGQEYQLAFGEWRLRNKTLGLFSVALPSNFIVNTAVTSRNLLSTIFALATMLMFLLGFWIARRIIQPLNRLVQISMAVSRGDLEQQTGIRSLDEIGQLAEAFDAMTRSLAERNNQLVEQASKLETVLHSITDGVIMVDADNNIVTANPSARTLLRLDEREQSNGSLMETADILPIEELLLIEPEQGNQRYEIGSRVFSAESASALSPTGDHLGAVIVLRDITREAEAEHLRDGFITSVSHELRTPLTSIKGYIDLLLLTANGSLQNSHKQLLQ
jgi:PAS domain-containing protein